MRGRTLISLGFALITLILWANNPTFSPHVETVSVSNAHVHVIVEPTEGLTPLLSAITTASSTIDVVMYQFEDPVVAHALALARARGVAVRVILNGGYYGKKEKVDNDMAYQYLVGHGAEVHWSPSRFALTHQKTVVIDHAQAFIMTGNFTPQYYATSRDFEIVDSDSEDVRDIEKTFDADWNNDTHDSHTNNSLVWSPGSEQRLVDIIARATTTLDIYNQEMADTKIISALTESAARGVVIRIVMTENSRWHKAWRELTHAGVQIHLYAAHAPTYIHAKMILAGNSTMFVGSENFSKNSLEKNRELGLMVSDPAAIAHVKEVFEEDYSIARPFGN